MIHRIQQLSGQTLTEFKRAQILLGVDADMSEDEIDASIGVGGSAVYRTKRRFVEGSPERALSEELRPGAERKLAGNEEGLLVATARSNPPKGRARWTLELQAGEMVKLTAHESLSRETVRRRLADVDLKPWRRKMWCIPAGRRRRRRPHGGHAPSLCRGCAFQPIVITVSSDRNRGEGTGEACATDSLQTR
jgi:transposase